MTFMGIFYAVAAVVCVFISALYFLYNGTNPLGVWVDAMEDLEIDKERKKMQYWKGVPRSPGLLLLTLIAICGFAWVVMTFTWIVTIIAGWLGLMVACALAFVLFTSLLRILDGKKRIEGQPRRRCGVRLLWWYHRIVDRLLGAGGTTGKSDDDLWDSSHSDAFLVAIGPLEGKEADPGSAWIYAQRCSGSTSKRGPIRTAPRT